jgi:hypothetical protein
MISGARAAHHPINNTHPPGLVEKKEVGMVKFQIKKGDVLFQDEEDNVAIYHLQRQEEGQDGWITVLSLHLEGGRAWGDEIDQLYRHRTRSDFIIHISGFGYWGDAEFFRSQDNGLTWEPFHTKYGPDPAEYIKEPFEIG